MTPEELAREAARRKQTFAQASGNLDAITQLEELEAKGELRPAEKAALEALRKRQASDAKTVGETGATYRGFQQGATFNFADEIGGLVRGEEHKQAMREKDRQAEMLYPEQFGQGKLAGGVTSGLATAPIGGAYVGGAKGMAGLIGRSGLVGGIEGAIWGAGEGEGLAGRIPPAVKSGALGALVGMATPPAVALGMKAGRAGIDAAMGGVDAAINRGSKSRANRAIVDALRRSGVSADDAARSVARAAAEGQPEFRLMDAMGVSGQRLASGVTRAGGDGAEEIAQFLRQRQIDQGDRVSGFVQDAFGATNTAAKTTEELNAARKATNTKNYAAARANAGPVNLNDTIGSIDDLLKRNPIVGESGLASSEIGGRLESLRGRLTDGNEQLIDFDSVLNVKEDLGRVIGRIKRSGDEVPYELSRVYGELDKALEASSDAYRAANDAAFAGRKVVGAVDEGAQMARPGTRATDNIDRFSAMTPEEQAAARVGYGDRALARIESNAAPTADKSRPFRSTKAQAESGAMATDPELFSNRIAREGDMWETQNRALGGSRTADNLQDIRNTGPVGNIIRALRDVGNLQFGQAAQNVGAAVAPLATGRNEATRKLIAEALMSAQASNVLQPIEQMQAREAIIRRLLEGATRGGGREAIQ